MKINFYKHTAFLGEILVLFFFLQYIDTIIKYIIIININISNIIDNILKHCKNIPNLFNVSTIVIFENTLNLINNLTKNINSAK